MPPRRGEAAGGPPGLGVVYLPRALSACFWMVMPSPSAAGIPSVQPLSPSLLPSLPFLDRPYPPPNTLASSRSVPSPESIPVLGRRDPGATPSALAPSLQPTPRGVDGGRGVLPPPPSPMRWQQVLSPAPGGGARVRRAALTLRGRATVRHADGLADAPTPLRAKAVLPSQAALRAADAMLHGDGRA